VRRADNLNTPHVPIVLKSGNLNLLKPSGSVQAYNGMALPYLKSLKASHMNNQSCKKKPT